MKIKRIDITKPYRVFQQPFSLSLQNEFTGEIYDRVLLSGPNASGKSTILDLIRSAWTLADLGFSVHGMPLNKELPYELELVDFLGKSAALRNGTEEDQFRYRLVMEPERMRTLAQERKRLKLNQNSLCPNVVYLDAARQWVNPQRNVGETFVEEIDRWLVAYHPTSDWKTQLELAMLNLKLVDQEKYARVLDDLNEFLVGKRIENEVFEEDKGRIRVSIQGGGHHTLDLLSSGEQQVLIMLFLISRYLQPGGIVLIDEPDLFLHPSLVERFMSKIEALVRERDGQLIVASHNPSLWDRYETLGLRVRLGGNAHG